VIARDAQELPLRKTLLDDVVTRVDVADVNYNVGHAERSIECLRQPGRVVL
jgi:hypothetical protein